MSSSGGSGGGSTVATYAVASSGNVAVTGGGQNIVLTTPSLPLGTYLAVVTLSITDTSGAANAFECYPASDGGTITGGTFSHFTGPIPASGTILVTGSIGFTVTAAGTVRIWVHASGALTVNQYDPTIGTYATTGCNIVGYA